MKRSLRPSTFISMLSKSQQQQQQQQQQCKEESNNKPAHFFCLNNQMEQIYNLINTTKHNKEYIGKYHNLLKPIIQALSGADASFLQNAEFYSDLKETLNKMYHHLVESSKRKAITRFLMSKRNQEVIVEMQKHIDTLCGRIFLSNAYRMQSRQFKQQKSF